MSKIIEALRSAVEHRERVSLDDIDVADLLGKLDRLQAERDALKSALGRLHEWAHVMNGNGIKFTGDHPLAVAKSVLDAAPKPGEQSKATAAWADIPDATQWLEDLRGNTGEPT
jgi:hypothetical protein